MTLSNDAAILRYDPGGSYTRIVYLWKIPKDISDAQLPTSTIRLVSELKPKLYKIHTRMMRREFSNKYCNIAGTNIPPYVLRSLYAELTLDASADQNPALDTRARLALLGQDPDLVIDMRHLNKGRPNDTFNAFFEALEKEVQSLMAADERRHNVEHVSHFISVPDLINQVKTKIPEGSPLPSEATVLLSFVPKNSHHKVAKLYQSRIPLRMTVQTRQLRAEHMDDHFCSAMFRYMKEYSVKYRTDVKFVCLDDKSKLDDGEPTMASGVRGKKAIVPLNSMLSCLDHDVQSKGSLTPSVCLSLDVPEEADHSFYRGQVSLVLTDSAFQASTTFRHGIELQKNLEQDDRKPILMLYTDVGPDHRLTYHAVKLSLIVLFRRLNLEILIAGRTAPGHSWVNTAERIMSLMNLAFQNTALSRNECSSDIEQVLKSCGSMADVRKKVNDLKEKWIESVQPMIYLLQNRARHGGDHNRSSR